MGPHLAEKAREITERLGKHDCKGSNGWLGDVQGETVDSWKERFPEIIMDMTKMMFGILMDNRHFFFLSMF